MADPARPPRGLIAALSPDGIIGKGGTLPWHRPGDLRRFKRMTLGTNVILGRRTWESQGSKPLAGRRNLVITGSDLPGAECFRDIDSALAACDGPVWFLGGRGIFAEGMRHADLIDITYIPDHVPDGPDAVRFPPIDPAVWVPGPLLVHEDDPALRRRVYTRR